ncbi:hypothetical protein SDJN03_20931, partial [Cucurbita argyrosperma subsp. sororia]
MEVHPTSSLQDEREDPSVMVEKEVTESVSSSPQDVQTNRSRENVMKTEPSQQIGIDGETSMEASMSADDVLRAGGFVLEHMKDHRGRFLDQVLAGKKLQKLSSSALSILFVSNFSHLSRPFPMQSSR